MFNADFWEQFFIVIAVSAGLGLVFGMMTPEKKDKDDA